MFASTSTSTAWQESIRSQLIHKEANHAALAPLIDQYGRLAKQTKALKDRNTALLRAATAGRSDPANSRHGNDTGAGQSNPVLQAFISDLERDLAGVRNELSGAYKTQGQNALKLLSLTETLREKDDETRAIQEELRRLQETEARWQRSQADFSERMRQKDDSIQVLQDELSALNLELMHTVHRNENLKKDNASLLARWIDKMNDEVKSLNDEQEKQERARIEAVSFFQSYGFSEQLAEGSSRMIRIGNDLEASGVLVARDSVDGDEDWEKVARE